MSRDTESGDTIAKAFGGIIARLLSFWIASYAISTSVNNLFHYPLGIANLLLFLLGLSIVFRDFRGIND